MKISYFLLILFCVAITVQISNCDRQSARSNHQKYDPTNVEKSIRKRRKYEDIPDVNSVEEIPVDEEGLQRDEIQSNDETSSADEEQRYIDNYRRRKYKSIHRYDNSGSFESLELALPIRYRGVPRFDYAAENRPLFNFLLGILDTFKASTKQELRRAQERERRQRSQLFIDDVAKHVKNLTTILLPINILPQN